MANPESEQDIINREAAEYWSKQKPPRQERGKPKVWHVDGGIAGLYEKADAEMLSTVEWFSPDKSKPHSNKILFYGVSASGKDYLIELVSKMVDVPRISVSSIMSAELGVPGDEIRYVADTDKHLAAKMAAAEKILAVDEPQFVSAHFMTKHYLVEDKVNMDPHTQGAPVYLIQDSFDEKVNPMHIVVVIGDPEEIIKRREKGNEEGRHREVEDIETITFHQYMTVKKAMETARKLGAGFHIVYNTNSLAMTSYNERYLAKLTRDIKEMSHSL